jgi:hypothetical protein
VYSADQKHIWVTGAGSVTLSSNAGRSWSLAKSDSQFIYQSVQSSQKVVWFAGSNGSLQSYQDTTTITAVERSNMEIDKSKFALDVFPNPSNGTAVITFQLGRKQLVKIELYDILGRQIKILLDEELNPGRHTLPLRLDESASAIYLIYCSTNERVTTKQFLFIK